VPQRACLPAEALYECGKLSVANSVYYLQFPDGTPFGYYSYLTD